MNENAPESDPQSTSSSRRTPWIACGLVGLALLAGLAWYCLSPVMHTSTATATRTFSLEVDFSRFRQLMIRKSPTAAIVSHGGMKLIDETVQDLKVDRSKDDRPILNAIRGQSKIELDAVRTLTVELNDPHIKTEQLTLRQIADIDIDQLRVTSTGVGQQQSVKAYETVLMAKSEGNRSTVTLDVAMTIEIDVPRLFTGVADQRIQEASEKALADQQDAITQFVIDHADESIILPDFLNRSNDES